jgi:hypothetical protein
MGGKAAEVIARIARVVAPDIAFHIIQGGTGGTAGEMSMVSPELAPRHRPRPSARCSALGR